MTLLLYLDVLIGLSVVMVLLSTVVTAATQVVLSAWYTRARHLRKGLETLIAQIDPDTLGKPAHGLADLVLRHPAIGRDTGRVLGRVTRWVRGVWHRYQGASYRPQRNPGAVIERHELIRVLLELASGTWKPEADNAAPAGLARKDAEGKKAREKLDALREPLRTALAKAGVLDPGATLTAIRDKSQELEKVRPEQPQSERMAQAILEVAKSDFVGKITMWFDQTMDRTTQRFTLEARTVTVVAAFFVALFLQVDSLAVIARLSVDPALRSSFVEQAKASVEQAQKAPALDPTMSSEKAWRDLNKRFTEVNQPGLAALIAPMWECPAARSDVDARMGEWNTSWSTSWVPDVALRPVVWAVVAPWRALTKDDACKPTGRIDGERATPTGFLLTWVLLSFGAPFWFDAVKNLLKLRPLLAQKEETERNQKPGA